MFPVVEALSRLWNRRATPPSDPVLAERYGALFDVRHYRGRFPDAGESVDAIVRHYRTIGAPTGSSPSPLLAIPFYLAQAGAEAAEDPVGHFRSVGWRRGLDPHPLFDTARYTKAFGQAIEPWGDPVSHYLSVGWRSGVSPSDALSIAYCASRMKRSRRGLVEPSCEILRGELSDLRRPHPCLSVPIVRARLAQTGLATNDEQVLERFARWDAPWSPSPLFDVEFYRRTYPEAAVHPRGAFGHFLEIGQYGDFDPNPYFDSAWYRRRHADRLGELAPFLHYMVHEGTLAFDPSPEFSVRHYARQRPKPRVPGESLLEHFLRQGRYTQVTVRPDPIPESLGRQLAEAAKIEPAIDLSARRLTKLPVYLRYGSPRVAQLLENLRASIDRPFSAAVFAPFLSRGGADLVAIHLVRWLQQTRSLDDVLLVITESDLTKSLDWLPPGTRVLVLSHLADDLKPAERERLLQDLIETFRPEVCHNVNSRSLWQLVSEKGRALSKLTRLRASLFCFDYDPQGNPTGFAVRYLKSSIEWLESIASDNATFRRAAAETLGLSSDEEAKFRTLYNPAKSFGGPVGVDERLARLAAGSGRRQVMWAGRVDRQKRPELLAEIARRAPEIDFHVFGDRLLGRRDLLEGAPPNIVRYGEYREFFELPLARMDSFLYTAAWDGIPNILIDAMQAGLPVVAPEVGGIAELVDDRTGWLIRDHGNPDAYLQALREIFARADRTRERIDGAAQRLAERHSWAHWSAEATRIFGLPEHDAKGAP